MAARRLTEADVLGLVNAVLDARLPQGMTEPMTAVVESVTSGSRYLLARIGSGPPVPVWRPALPDLPRAGDRVGLTRGPGGYLVVTSLLDRDPPEPVLVAPPPAEDDEDDDPGRHDLAAHSALGLAGLADIGAHASGPGHLLSFNTPNTLDTGDGHWAKVGAGSIADRFGSVAATALLDGQGSNGTTWVRGMLRFRVRQQAVFGSAPSVVLELLDGADIVGADVSVVVTDDAGPTEFGLWLRLTREYEWAVVTPLWTRPDRCDWEWLSCEALEASLPAGDGTTATEV